MDNNSCFLCPRNCGVDRRYKTGFCKAGSRTVVAKTMLHQWEEPCICYLGGSGCVFFSGCQLQCVFCQNHDISWKITGKTLTDQDLAELFIRLEAEGACNINLVSPTPYLKSLINALEIAKGKGLSIPILYNSGGYEKLESLRALDGLIDVYLPDFKFSSPELSLQYAGAKNYADFALLALEEMLRQVGPFQWIGKELHRGVIVRHLVLPNHTSDSIAVLDLLSTFLPHNDLILSLLRQYTPVQLAAQYPKLNRKLTSLEYSRVVKHAEALCFSYIYTQKKDSASTEFIPDFSKFS